MENDHFNEPGRRIPKSLNECLTPYPISEDLYHWAERLKLFGEIACGIVIILGIFSIVPLMEDMKSGADFIALLTAMIPWVLYVIITYSVFRISALLLEALAATLQCRVINTKVALWEAKKKAETSSQKTSDPSAT